MKVAAGVLAAALISISGVANAGFYQCVNDAGKMMFQDKPCSSGQRVVAEPGIAVAGTSEGNREAQMRLVKDIGVQMRAYLQRNPDWKKAMEVGAVEEAGISWQDLHIYSIGLEYCPKDAALTAAIKDFRQAGDPLLKLGERFYKEGYDLVANGKTMKRTAPEIHAELAGLEQIRREKFRAAGTAGYARLCAESAQALSKLASEYRKP